MPPFKVAIIGTGARSCSYARVYGQTPEIELVALADPIPRNRQVMMKLSNLPGGYAEYDDWDEMLREHDDLDGVVITTPNHLHTEPAIACLERGLPIALEKPLATRKGDCERIIDAETANNGRSLIGFVLRSTPFYSTIFDLLVTQRAIGPVVSIQADELPGWVVSSIMNRSPWRRYERSSGGAMLEKSCHDMDILNWMMGCRPRSLNSYGDRKIFTPNAALPETCDDCGVGETCRYFRRPAFGQQEDASEDDMQHFIREDHRCIYNIDKDGVDVQSVNIEYENGAVANFMLNMNTGGERAGRNFHAVGLRGRVWGNMHGHKVFHFDNATDELTTIDTRGDGSDHGGGGRVHALELLRMMQEPDYVPPMNARAGYLSAVMCMATDISRVERRRVEFAYTEDGWIEMI